MAFYKQVACVMASPLYKQLACCVLALYLYKQVAHRVMAPPLFSKFKLAIVKIGNVSPSFSEINS
jgi:hypothetical protein